MNGDKQRRETDQRSVRSAGSSWGAVRSERLAARAWWALLPYIGYYSEGFDRVKAWPFYQLWKLVGKLPGSDPFKPTPPIICDCDYCRGVPGAEWTP